MRSVAIATAEPHYGDVRTDRPRAIVLAAGVTLGEYLGRPVGARRDRYAEHVRPRAMTAD